MSAAIDDARRTSARLLWLAVVLALPCLFILLPMIAFLIYGFWHVEGTDIVRSFSLKSYVDFLGNEAYVSGFFKTFALALKLEPEGPSNADAIRLRNPSGKQRLLVTFELGRNW